MSLAADSRASWVIFFGGLIVYAAFPTRNYYWDGIHFAHTIENAVSCRELLHPNHLIYNFIGYFFYSAINSIFPGTRSLYVLQYLNCVLADACAVIMFHILRSLLRSQIAALALTALFAFSATWWKYSTDADAYVASVLFLLISFYLLQPERKARPLVVALMHVLAMCFHQLAVFFFPVVVTGLLFQTRGLPGKERIRAIAQYTFPAAGITLALYAVAFCWMTGGLEPRGFFKWMTSYSPEIGFVFNAGESLKYTFRGLVQLFFGGRFSFVKEVPSPVSVIVFTAIAAAVGWLIAGLLHKSREPDGRADVVSSRPVLIVCLVWIAVYLVFLFFFIPQATFYRLFSFPPLIILIGLAIDRLGPKPRGAVPAVVTICALSNFLLYIYPHSRVRPDTPLALATQLQNVWSERTVVGYSLMTSDALLAKYFNPGTVWVEVRPPTTDGLAAQLDMITPREFWLETSAIKELQRTPEGAAWLEAHVSPNEPAYSVGDPYDVTFVRIRQ